MKTLLAYSRSLSFLCALVVLSGSCKKHHTEEPLIIIPTVNPIQHSVMVYLLTPNDQTFNPQYYKGVKSCVLNLQNWYKSQIGSKTFVLNPAVVDTITGLHNSAWYNTNNGVAISGNSGYGFHNTAYDIQQLLGVKYNTNNITYFVFVAASFPDETIPKGLAVEGLNNIKGLAGANPNPSMGASGHALGHAFGLTEVAVENAQAIMSTGFPLYPNCILQQPEIDSLNASPFFTVQ
jgi:hypothetical protein